MDNHVKNKKYGNFVSISSLTGEYAAEKLKNFCSSSLWTCLYHIYVILYQTMAQRAPLLMVQRAPSKFHKIK